MNLRDLLAQTRLFAGLPEDALDDLVRQVSVRHVSSGETVYDFGGVSDCFYLVALGRLRALSASGKFIADVGRLESVGEVGVLSGEPRHTHVYAIRDSELLQIDRAPLLQFLLKYPAALLELTRAVIARLQQRTHTSRLDAERLPRSFAIVPAHAHVDIHAVATQLHETLNGWGTSLLLDAPRIDATLGPGCAGTAFCDSLEESTLLHYLHELEASNAYLVFVADRYPSLWSQRCLRQADRVLVVANAGNPVQGSGTLDELARSGIRAPIDLVLLRAEGQSAGDVSGWRQHVHAESHYFVRPGHSGDTARLARSLTGRAVGLVLGGGGARGFAHLGLLRALEEQRIPIDVVGGASMGAFLGALTAVGYSAADVTRIARETFVQRNLLNDVVLPRVSLLRGRKFVSRLRDIFGELRIEALPVSYFCVSTNLTRGRAEIHDRGLLAPWVATSMAVPGVAPPVAYRGDYLVDGALINPLPTDIMQNLGRGPIIASDVTTEGALSAPADIEGPDPEAVFRRIDLVDGSILKPTLLSILFRTATLTSEAEVARRAERADWYLHMPVSGVGLFDWKKLDELSQQGYELANQNIENFHRLLSAR